MPEEEEEEEKGEGGGGVSKENFISPKSSTLPSIY